MHFNIVCVLLLEKILFLIISPHIGEFELHLLNKFHQQNVKLQVMWKKNLNIQKRQINTKIKPNLPPSSPTYHLFISFVSHLLHV